MKLVREYLLMFYMGCLKLTIALEKINEGNNLLNFDNESVSLEYQLKRILLNNYDITSRPVRNDRTVIDVVAGISLFHILETNERHQTLSALFSLRFTWVDEYLNWENRTEYNLTKLWIPAKNIWKPDIIISNYANDEYGEYMNTNAIVERDGSVLWMFPIVIKMYCTLDVRYFPFDQQQCNITLISWTYNGYQLNLRPQMKGNMVYYKPENQQWAVNHIVPHFEVSRYTCCPEPFPVVNFEIQMHRRSLFYVINLICPCLLIYCVSFLGFYLPIESGEKVNLEITVLLALVVFLLMISETMPPTPDGIPLIGLLFGITMIMVSIAVVMAVVVTNVFFRQEIHPISPLARKLAFMYISRSKKKKRKLKSTFCKPNSHSTGHSLPTTHSNHHRNCRMADYTQQSLLRMRTLSLESLERCGDNRYNTSYQCSNDVSRISRRANKWDNSISPTDYSDNTIVPRNFPDSCYTAPDEEIPPNFPDMSSNVKEDECSVDWHKAAFMLDTIFFWIFSCLTGLMMLIIAFIGYPAFIEKHAI